MFRQCWVTCIKCYWGGRQNRPMPPVPESIVTNAIQWGSVNTVAFDFEEIANLLATLVDFFLLRWHHSTELTRITTIDHSCSSARATDPSRCRKCVTEESMAPLGEGGWVYSLFTLRRARSPLRIKGERALLRVKRL